MAYGFDFASIAPYSDVLANGVVLTLELTAIGTVLGVGIGTLGAAARTSGNRLLSGLVGAYVELIRNTPFLVQLFFIFFGLPALVHPHRSSCASGCCSASAGHASTHLRPRAEC
jgi:polar amino acid transport system permease protein